jgi:hypothetical protein
VSKFEVGDIVRFKADGYTGKIQDVSVPSYFPGTTPLYRVGCLGAVRVSTESDLELYQRPKIAVDMAAPNGEYTATLTVEHTEIASAEDIAELRKVVPFLIVNQEPKRAAALTRVLDAVERAQNPTDPRGTSTLKRDSRFWAQAFEAGKQVGMAEHDLQYGFPKIPPEALACGGDVLPTVGDYHASVAGKLKGDFILKPGSLADYGEPLNLTNATAEWLEAQTEAEIRRMWDGPMDPIGDLRRGMEIMREGNIGKEDTEPEPESWRDRKPLF